MAYPNVSAAEARESIAHVTTALCDNTTADLFIVEAKDYVESKLSGYFTLASIQLDPTPEVLRLAIMFCARSKMLEKAYAQSLNVGSTPDIKYWKDECDKIIQGLIDGDLQMLDSSGDPINAAGAAFKASNNKTSVQLRYFGHGDQGQHVVDPEDEVRWVGSE